MNALYDHLRNHPGQIHPAPAHQRCNDENRGNGLQRSKLIVSKNDDREKIRSAIPSNRRHGIPLSKIQTGPKRHARTLAPVLAEFCKDLRKRLLRGTKNSHVEADFHSETSRNWTSNSRGYKSELSEGFGDRYW